MDEAHLRGDTDEKNKVSVRPLIPRLFKKLGLSLEEMQANTPAACVKQHQAHRKTVTGGKSKYEDLSDAGDKIG